MVDVLLTDIELCHGRPPVVCVSGDSLALEWDCRAEAELRGATPNMRLSEPGRDKVPVADAASRPLNLGR